MHDLKLPSYTVKPLEFYLIYFWSSYHPPDRGLWIVIPHYFESTINNTMITCVLNSKEITTWCRRDHLRALGLVSIGAAVLAACPEV